MTLNAAIAEDIKVKQNEIASIQTQIEFNQQVAEDNSKYISVTTLIERFGQPFDESFWSAYKALEKMREDAKLKFTDTVLEKKYETYKSQYNK